jgi:hypothetical protein
VLRWRACRRGTSTVFHGCGHAPVSSSPAPARPPLLFSASSCRRGLHAPSRRPGRLQSPRSEHVMWRIRLRLIATLPSRPMSLVNTLKEMRRRREHTESSLSAFPGNKPAIASPRSLNICDIQPADMCAVGGTRKFAVVQVNEQISKYISRRYLESRVSVVGKMVDSVKVEGRVKTVRRVERRKLGPSHDGRLIDLECKRRQQTQTQQVAWKHVNTRYRSFDNTGARHSMPVHITLNARPVTCTTNQSHAARANERFKLQTQ